MVDSGVIIEASRLPRIGFTRFVKYVLSTGKSSEKRNRFNVLFEKSETSLNKNLIKKGQKSREDTIRLSIATITV